MPERSEVGSSDAIEHDGQAARDVNQAFVLVLSLAELDVLSDALDYAYAYLQDVNGDGDEQLPAVAALADRVRDFG
jgi:hypothetical protein